MSLNSFDLDVAIHGTVVYLGDSWNIKHHDEKMCRREQKTQEQNKKQERHPISKYNASQWGTVSVLPFSFWALFEDPKVRHSAAHMQGLSPGMPWAKVS